MNVRNLLRLSLLLLLSLNPGYALNAIAQEEPCGCQTNAVNIGTGINPTTGVPLPPGTTPQNFDPSWVVTQSPDPTISIPAIPWIIPNGAGVWGSGTPALHTALVGAASYISPFNTQGYMVNNPAPQPAFIFRLDFCVCASNQYTLTGLFNADDYAELWLDGTTLLSTCPSWHNVVNVSSTFPLSAGSHYLEIHLRNTGAQAMGVALSGNITSSNGANTLMGYDCCHAAGGVNGRKYLDANCNGQIDANDPIGAGWTFTLNPGGYTATSDGLGYFNFPGIPAGTYTLSETPQPGWTPVLPPGGSTTVNIVAGQVVTVDFLNTECDPGGSECDDKCYWRITGNNTITPSNYLGTNTAADLIVKTNGTERARIEGTGDGNMGISTASPTTILHTYAAPPPAGAPSGLRFEDLPWGTGYILVTDDDGYVYRMEDAVKKSIGSPEMMEMQQQVNELKREISELRALLQGSDANSLSISPNPTTGQVNATFRIAQTYTTAMVRIIDNAGRTVISSPVSGSEGTTSLVIPVSSASGNLSCVLIVDGKAIATEKLILLNK